MASVRADHVRSNNLLPLPVPAFHEDVRDDIRDQPGRGVFRKDRHVGNAGKGCEKIRTVRGTLHRPPLPLQPADGCVAVQSHEENVPQRRRAPKILRVPRVEEIEAAVGENDPLPFAAETGAEGPHPPARDHAGRRVFRYARGFRSAMHGILLLVSSTTAGSIVAMAIPSSSPTDARRSPSGETITESPE